MKNSTSVNQGYIDQVKQNYDREMASLTWNNSTSQIILDVHALASRLYNTGYYTEFYGDIVDVIAEDLELCVIHNRNHFNAVLTIAMTMYQFKFPQEFNQLCHQHGADNVAIWFTDAM